MRLRKSHDTPETSINIAPLIDVVFLLIIFFMVVSHIARIEVDNLTLPEASQGQHDTRPANERLVVNLHHDGRIVVAGNQQTIDSLGRLLSQHVKQRGAENVSVLIRGDRTAAWQGAADVMRACGTNSIHQVSVSVVDTGLAPVF